MQRERRKIILHLELLLWAVSSMRLMEEKEEKKQVHVGKKKRESV